MGKIGKNILRQRKMFDEQGKRRQALSFQRYKNKRLKPISKTEEIRRKKMGQYVIDPEIRPLVELINEQPYAFTLDSCQGHYNYDEGLSIFKYSKPHISIELKPEFVNEFIKSVNESKKNLPKIKIKVAPEASYWSELNTPVVERDLESFKGKIISPKMYNIKIYSSFQIKKGRDDLLEAQRQMMSFTNNLRNKLEEE